MRRYGNHNEDKEDVMRCVEEVAERGVRWINFYQCSRKRGHGKDGLYCRQHAKAHPAETVLEVAR